jgi:hypothetical protein
MLEYISIINNNKMQPYKNLSGQSGIELYVYENDSITVKFKEKNKSGHDTYKYTYQSAGNDSIEKMKGLADIGQGLHTYINQEVRKKYDSKW